MKRTVNYKQRDEILIDGHPDCDAPTMHAATGDTLSVRRCLPTEVAGIAEPMITGSAYSRSQQLLPSWCDVTNPHQDGTTIQTHELLDVLEEGAWFSLQALSDIFGRPDSEIYESILELCDAGFQVIRFMVFENVWAYKLVGNSKPTLTTIHART